MAWLAIKLFADARVAEALADALIEAGALSVSCDDADAGTPAEAPQFAEPGENSAQPWQRNVLTALVASDSMPATIVAEAADACGIAPPGFEASIVENEDWVRLTQRQFGPMHICGRLWIVPSWCQPPRPSALNISIDPGLAFGTGSHPTTRLMLRWLEATIKGGESVLDYGCGSGILAIAASRLGARDVIGVDIDPQSIVAATDNAAKNRVPARFACAEAFQAEPSDIVVANILANPLIVLAPLIRAQAAHRVALSGVLEPQADGVMAAYSVDFAIEVAGREEGWVLLAGVRR
jgi:ribosomal protein L11 methyltransferase